MRFRLVEGLKNLVLYHTSKSDLKNLTEYPMFCCYKKEQAEALDGKVYQIKFKGNVIDRDSLIDKIDNFIDLEADICSNPDNEELKGIVEIIKTKFPNVDAISYLDYDFTDYNQDEQQILIFNPKQTCVLVNKLKEN